MVDSTVTHRRGRLATGGSPGSGARAGQQSGASQGTLREHNLSIVLGRIVEARTPVSRASVATATGLSRGTVSSLVDRLVEAGLVEELTPVSTARAGRPAVPLVPARGTVVALGLEINVDYVAARALDLAGRQVYERVEAGDYRDSPPDVALGVLAEVADEALTVVEGSMRHKGRVPQIAGAFLALPGLVDRRTGPLRIAPNLGWRDLDVAAELSGHRLLEHGLWLANEANLAARAEAHVRADEGGSASFLYVSGEVGVGAAVVLDGEIFAGRHGWTGELGHTVVPTGSGGERLEVLVGQDALMRTAGLPRTATVADLAAVATRDDDGGRARAALAAAGGVLGRGLANALNLLDVDHIVLGGIYATLADHLRETVLAELRDRVLAAPWAEIEVSTARAGAYPALTGGALAVLRSVVADPLAYGVSA